ncbi:hypothetical protein DINM_006842 [Dirofilaria immitis]|nr:hypothetical protein [Dirofilaria immitis]
MTIHTIEADRNDQEAQSQLKKLLDLSKLCEEQAEPLDLSVVKANDEQMETLDLSVMGINEQTELLDLSILTVHIKSSGSMQQALQLFGLRETFLAIIELEKYRLIHNGERRLYNCSECEEILLKKRF